MPGQQRKSRPEGSFSKPADPLEQAFRVQREAAALNFDWPDAAGALDKLREEVEELHALLDREPTAASRATHATTDSTHATTDSTGTASGPEAGPAGDAIQEEVGDLLFAAVNVARLCGVTPSEALASATLKFERRFGEVLSRAEEQGGDPRRMSLEELDRLWERVKRRERRDRP